MSEGRELLLSEEAQSDFAVSLYRQGMFGIEEDPDNFRTLKSGRVSPHYLDMRPGISTYETRQEVAGYMVQLANLRAQEQGFENMQEAYDYLAGTPEAFTSYAASMADLAQMGVLQPRVDVLKASGNKTPILGAYQEGARVAEFDDVVTDGDSKVSTVKGFTTGRLVVADYFVVVDREEGGTPLVRDKVGIDMTAALTVSNMVTMLLAESEINQTRFDNVGEYIERYGEAEARKFLNRDEKES